MSVWGSAKSSNEAEGKRRPIHERLDVFVLARRLAIELYKATARFPREEKFGLVAQIRRAAVSIPANIAEGAARNSKRDFARFLLTARGSATELRLLLDIACETGSLAPQEFRTAESALNRVIAMTSGLIARCRRA